MVELRQGFTRNVQGLGHRGLGDLEVRIRDHADLERAGDLIRRALETS
ncbi:hypothetical protein [Allostreptomyces psammosilenae]|uniref:Putative transport protein n=1 Tax=Allostreptomyces psammosilenae TaxID=1892865 RepID=A0A852ZZ98_9ACTN|nr:hypothetical protein [Allostreptomyces psammosilenae]NYI03448.1 putative transport protein [Allostreptomyces psammosilenae]